MQGGKALRMILRLTCEVTAKYTERRNRTDDGRAGAGVLS